MSSSMRDALAIVAWLCMGCGGPGPTADADAGRVEEDASVVASDADTGSAPDAADTRDAALDYPSVPRLTVAFGTGQVVSWTFDPVEARATSAHVVDLGAEITAMGARPESDDHLVATDGEMHVVRQTEEGALQHTHGPLDSPGNVVALAFDRSGGWAFAAADEGLFAAEIDSDGAPGDWRSLSSCSASAVQETGGAIVAACRDEARIVRVVVDATGPSSAETVASLPTTAAGIAAWDSELLVATVRRNSPDDGTYVLRIGMPEGGTSGFLTLAPTDLDVQARPYATAVARHPTRPVAYVIHGGSYQYGGNGIAVVGTADPGDPRALQYLSLPSSNTASSRAASVTPDGRWLIVGTWSIGDLRAWPIDREGRLGAHRFVALADEPVFLGVR